MSDARIAKIEWGMLWGKRPRPAGSNAHMEPLGDRVRVPIARVTLDDGTSGFGLSRAERGAIEPLVGAPLGEAVKERSGVIVGIAERFHPIENALWDLLGKREGLPVYALTTRATGQPVPDNLRVRCYDTTLYLDDVDLADDAAGGERMAAEAMQGWGRGHRNFKIKVGRGNVFMPTEAGLRRDIAVVNAIRRAVGPDAAIMTDANNGYTYNIARDFLRGTADARPFWLEEAFWEDASTYRRLKAWIRAEGMETRIADGEGRGLVDLNYPTLYEGVENLASGSEVPSGRLLDMLHEGIVDVLQYDIIMPGISRWLEVGPLVDAWGRAAAPHHYGTCWGNYGSAHLAPAIRNFLFVEWDEATTPGLNAPGYAVVDGYVHVPASPGFGLELEEEAYGRAVRDGGFTLS